MVNQKFCNILVGASLHVTETVTETVRDDEGTCCGW